MKYSWPGHHGWEHHQFIKKGEGEHPHPIGIEPEWAITHASALASDLPPSSLELQLTCSAAQSQQWHGSVSDP
jgi:hypothetical protein